MRMLARILFLLILINVALHAPAATTGDGDVNGDGLLTAADRDLVRDYLVNKVSLTSGQLTHVDVNGDAKVDICDLVKMTCRLFGKVTIDVTPNNGGWKLTGPAGFSMLTGTGDRIGAGALLTLPVGAYTLTCNDTLAGYAAPAAVTLTLGGEAAIAFTPAYYPISTLSLNAAARAGTINPAGDMDWYQFTIAKSASYVIETWTGTLADTALDLYGPNTRAAWLETNDNVGPSKAAKITRTLAAGTYYARVRGVGGAGNYTIQVRETIQTVTVNLPGNVPLVLVKCPAGSFQMGSPAAERGRTDDEGPAHTVTLSKPFYIGQYEVTQAQWKAVMGNNPSFFQPPTVTLNLNRPVEQVSWKDINGPNGFVAKLNAHLASTGQVGPLRLPTEAEWEYACRAGTTTRFYFGDSLGADDSGIDCATGSTAYPGNRRDYMWFSYNCKGNANGAYGSKAVGGKKPNAWGLYDMSGNVWEWCQDYYGSYSSGSAQNPTGPTSGDYRIFRGGGWYNAAYNCRSAYRLYYTPDYRYAAIGFRLARNN